MADDRILTGDEVLAEGLDDWRFLMDSLHTRYATGDFATALRLVDRIGEAAEAAGHHPDLDLRYGRLHIRLMSHDVHGTTARDVRLARRISEIAAEEGVTAEPQEVRRVAVALDTPDREEIKPFWRAVLGLSDHPSSEVDLVDPDGRAPLFWFQGTDPHEEPRQRFHVDVDVPHDAARERIDAALAAGGTLVTDEHAPAFWVLADTQGNKACICTWQGRD